jgi:hypothetical protein
MKEERRKYPRRELDLAAAITWPKPTPCTVVNLSADGAGLVAENGPSIPAEFDLALNSHLMRKCRVIWRNKNRIGIKFLPHPSHTVEIIHV